jgi:hypothetical protein
LEDSLFPALQTEFPDPPRQLLSTASAIQMIAKGTAKGMNDPIETAFGIFIS